MLVAAILVALEQPCLIRDHQRTVFGAVRGPAV